MSAPSAIAGGAQPGSGQNREPLKDKLRKLVPPPITKEIEEELEKIASGVRAKINAASDSDNADGSIRDGLRTIEPGLKHTRSWCKAQRIIGEELGKADDQPVRRIVSPPQKNVATVPKEPEEDQASSEESADIATEQPVQAAVDNSPPRKGRRMKWADDRIDEDAYIQRAFEEAMEYLPVCDGEPHPKARILVAKLIDGLGLAGPESPKP